MEEELDYKRDAELDPHALDLEWLDQPRKMERYTKIAARAQRSLDDANENLEFVKAKVEKDIRENPTAYIGDIRLTEALVQSTILLQDEYKDASRAVIEANFQLNTAKGAVRTMEHCKDSLEHLVTLFCKSYFAGPRVPRELIPEWENRERERNKRVDDEIGSAFDSMVIEQPAEQKSKRTK